MISSATYAKFNGLFHMDDSRLRSTLAVFAAATRRGVKDVNVEVGKRFAKRVLKGTPPLAQGWKRKDHTAFLRGRILDSRLPRGRITRAISRDGRMSKKQARAYYRVASARQGEMAAGWNALGRYAAVRPPAWIARHGLKHGSVRVMDESGGSQTVEVRFVDCDSKSRRFDVAKFGADALRGVFSGMRKAAEAIMKRRAKKR